MGSLPAVLGSCSCRLRVTACSFRKRLGDEASATAEKPCAAVTGDYGDAETRSMPVPAQKRRWRPGRHPEDFVDCPGGLVIPGIDRPDPGADPTRQRPAAHLLPSVHRDGWLVPYPTAT